MHIAVSRTLFWYAEFCVVTKRSCAFFVRGFGYALFYCAENIIGCSTISYIPLQRESKAEKTGKGKRFLSFPFFYWIKYPLCRDRCPHLSVFGISQEIVHQNIQRDGVGTVPYKIMVRQAVRFIRSDSFTLKNICEEK